MIYVTPSIALDEKDIEEHFIHAGGPGGQNVNKVATAVQLRFDAAGSSALPESVRARLRRLAGSRMTSDGVVVIEAKRFRTQERNRQDALERLVALIRKATETPKPRIDTKPSRSAKRKRVDAKKHRGAVKSLRGTVRRGDDV